MPGKMLEASHVVGTISHIAIYPVKSAAMIEVSRARISRSGLENDRGFMIVRAEQDNDGAHKFITQRDRGLSILALIKPELRDGDLYLTWDGKDRIAVPSVEENPASKILSIKIFRDAVVGGIDQGTAISGWLSDHLHTPTMLVRFMGQRRASQSYLENDSLIHYQDGYPIHWFMEQSLNELSQIAGQQIDWRRFRPNIVVSGGEARDEHLVYEGEINYVPFVNAKPCDRCQIPAVDPDSGQITGREPLQSLSRYKRWESKDREQKVIFGEYMLPLGYGEIHVGDRIEMTSVRNPPLNYGAKASL